MDLVNEQAASVAPAQRQQVGDELLAAPQRTPQEAFEYLRQVQSTLSNLKSQVDACVSALLDSHP
jgi:hypothetical protein